MPWELGKGDSLREHWGAITTWREFRWWVGKSYPSFFHMEREDTGPFVRSEWTVTDNEGRAHRPIQHASYCTPPDTEGWSPVKKEGAWGCYLRYPPVLKYAGTHTAPRRRLSLLFVKNCQGGNATNSLYSNVRLLQCSESRTSSEPSFALLSSSSSP